MKKVLLIAFVCLGITATAQINAELTPQGFAPTEITVPNQALEDLMETAKTWAYAYNKNGYDVSNVTANSLTISALKKSAFSFHNLGEPFIYDVKYVLKVSFNGNKCKLSFTVNEILQNNKPVKSTLASYFTSDGKLKEDFDEVKPTLEKTVGSMLQSFSDYMNRG